MPIRIENATPTAVQIVDHGVCWPVAKAADISPSLASMREKPTLDRVNAYNARTRDVRAYIDEEGDPAIEMDIPLSGGVSSTYLTRRLAMWRLSVEGYRAFLGLPPELRR